MARVVLPGGVRGSSIAIVAPAPQATTAAGKGELGGRLYFGTAPDRRFAPAMIAPAVRAPAVRGAQTAGVR